MASTRRRNRIVPFWNRIPQFFLYPFRGSPLVFNIGVSIATVVLLFIPIIGWLMLLVLFAVVLKYCFEGLRLTSEGVLDPPGVSGDSMFGDLGITFKYFLVFVVAFIFVGLTGSFLGPIIGMVAYVMVLALVPAATMALAVTGSFTSAINPALLLDTVKRIGWAYLALCGMLFAASLSSAGATTLIGQAGSSPLVLCLVVFATYYFYIMMFHMMGYVVYQYHEELDLDVVGEVFDDEGEDGPDLAMFEQFMDEENYAAALQELEGAIREYPDSVDLRERYHRLARITENARGLSANGGNLINKLMERGRVNDAVGVYADIARVVPDFRPDGPEQYEPIARGLRQRGEGLLAVKLINGFHKKYPGDERIPTLYLLAAQVLADDLNQPAQARPIVNFLMQKFPDSAVSFQVQQLHSALN